MQIKRGRLVLQLYHSFFKIGLVAFGGGYTVIPLLRWEAVENRRWITGEELTDIMAISQALPGIIMVNSATMIGYQVAGFWGALAATAAAITPTFVLTLLITMFFWDYTGIPVIRKAFAGILIGVAALIIHSLTRLWKTAVRSYFEICSVLLTSVLLIFFGVNAVLVIVLVAGLGFLYSLYNTVLRGK